MFSYSADENACVVVSVWSGESTDADYVRAIELLERMDDSAAVGGKNHINIALIAHGHKPPSATWRKRMSEANRGLLAAHYYFAVVTQSAVLRGVFTAVRWLVGARIGHYSGAFGTFAEAAGWIRKASGVPYPQLEAHYVLALHTSGLAESVI